jgi:carbohydrate kinase (thermoresistant glucokinase family)
MAAPVVIVMGVAGAGKSTVAAALNRRLGWPFQEGDDLHPAANIAKMHEGVPLTDADRAPWLAAVKAWIDARLEAGQPGLVTCSALKRSYRDFLVAGRPGVCILYLQAGRDELAKHLAHRTGHFMPPGLLDSQLATLEEPGEDEHAVTVRLRAKVADTVDDILRRGLGAVA